MPLYLLWERAKRRIFLGPLQREGKEKAVRNNNNNNNNSYFNYLGEYIYYPTFQLFMEPFRANNSITWTRQQTRKPSRSRAKV